MRPAVRAQHLGTAHQPTAIIGSSDILHLYRLPETWPAAAGVELGFGTEQRFAATYATVNTRLMTIVIRAGERQFSALLAANPVLLQTQLRPPFSIGFSIFIIQWSLLAGGAWITPQ